MADIKKVMKPMVSQLRPLVARGLPQAGYAIGNATGVPYGGMFGKELGARLVKIVGSGDYEMNTAVNSLFKGGGELPSASFGSDASTIRIRRREFLADLKTSSVAGEFVNYAYSINAGIRETFPFLSQLASNYEEYCFDGLVFEFVSSASPYISNTALGTVIASMQYNAASPVFTNKYTMENSAFAISARLDRNLMYGVECAKGSNPQNCYYTRTGTSTLPVTTTDLGQFQLAFAPSTTVPTNTVLGELWVTYDVVVKRPILNTNRLGFYHIYGSDSSAAAPFAAASSSTITETNTGAISFSRTSSTTLSFVDAVVGDQYMLVYTHYGTTLPGANAVDPTFVYTGCSATLAFKGDTASLIGGTGGINIKTIFAVLFTASSPTGSIQLTSASNWATGTTNFEAVVSSMGNNVLSTVW